MEDEQDKRKEEMTQKEDALRSRIRKRVSVEKDNCATSAPPPASTTNGTIVVDRFGRKGPAPPQREPPPRNNNPHPNNNHRGGRDNQRSPPSRHFHSRSRSPDGRHMRRDPRDMRRGGNGGNGGWGGRGGRGGRGRFPHRGGFRGHGGGDRRAGGGGGGGGGGGNFRRRVREDRWSEPPRKPYLSPDYLKERQEREKAPSNWDVGPNGQKNMPRMPAPPDPNIAGGTGTGSAQGMVAPGMPGVLMPGMLGMPGMQGMPGMPGMGMGMAMPGMMPPGLIPGLMSGHMLAGAVPSLMPRSGMQTRHARRLYIGNLDRNHGDEKEIQDFFETTIKSCLSEQDTPSNNILQSIYLNEGRGFAFIEFESIQLCTACIALNGLTWKGVPLRVKRPSDYDGSRVPPSTAPPIGLNLSGVEMEQVNTSNSNGSTPNPPYRLFIGGLNPQTTKAALRPIFEQLGALQNINVVPNSSNPMLCRGFAFVDYADSNVAGQAIATLNGQMFLGAMLKVQYSDPQMRGKYEQAHAPSLTATATTMGSLGGAAYNPAAALAAALAMTKAPPPGTMAPQGRGGHIMQLGVPMPLPTYVHPGLAMAGVPPLLSAAPALTPTSRVIVLMGMVPENELDDQNLYVELVSEISEECRKFGTLLSTVVPKDGAGRGKVYLQYEQIAHTAVAYRCLKGRKFGDAVVGCDFYSETDFSNGQYV